MPKILIQGATAFGQAGIGAPPRLEIATFVKPDNFRQFSLYIQVLREYPFSIDTVPIMTSIIPERMYERQSDDPLSFYQLSGIHGMPYTDWNHSPSENDIGQKKGYCIHRSSIFGSWHRPYMALLDVRIGHFDFFPG
jgi:tyrosinase